jgi:hypothetical protein
LEPAISINNHKGNLWYKLLISLLIKISIQFKN